MYSTNVLIPFCILVSILQVFDLARYTVYEQRWASISVYLNVIVSSISIKVNIKETKSIFNFIILVIKSILIVYLNILLFYILTLG